MPKRSITFLQMNDIHGYLQPHPELFWEGQQAAYREAGGLARIAGYFQAVRKEVGGNVIAVDNGDTIHGTFPAVHSRGEALVPLLNRLGLAAMTAHWEFAYGPDHFRKITHKLSYPMLAINCFETESGKPPYPSWTITECGGVRCGIVGIAATIVDKTMPPHFSTGLRFSIGNDELPAQIQRLREQEKVDLVVVLSHLGFPQDVKLAQETQGIDLVFSGHTHNRMYAPAVVNGAVIIQSGCHGSFVGRLDVEVDNRRVQRFSHRLVEMAETLPLDVEMSEQIEAILDPHREMLQEKVGSTVTPLNRNTILESSMDNLLLDAVARAAGTEIAFSNGWRYGAPIIPGPITMNDVWNMVPANPAVSVVELTGEELYSMLEENLEHTFASDPYRQMGGYVKRCRGINMYFKMENPYGHRIQHLFARGREVKLDQRYLAAFLGVQGVPSRYGESRRDTGIDAVTALKVHLRREETIGVGLRCNIVAI